MTSTSWINALSPDEVNRLSRVISARVPKITAVRRGRSVRQWIGLVDDVPLVDRLGRTRRFKTKRAAIEKARQHVART